MRDATESVLRDLNALVDTLLEVLSGFVGRINVRVVEAIEMEPLDKRHKSRISPLFMDSILIEIEQDPMYIEEEMSIVPLCPYSDLP